MFRKARPKIIRRTGAWGTRSPGKFPATVRQAEFEVENGQGRIGGKSVPPAAPAWMPFALTLGGIGLVTAVFNIFHLIVFGISMVESTYFF